MAFAKVEAMRLRYLADHQQDLRAEAYVTLRDALDSGDHNRGRIGTRVILPPSFVGSPRDMQRRYQDAMAIVRKYGKPHLFITVTCNPNWPEIHAALLPGQSPHDRPDIVARVFKAYLSDLIGDVVKRGIFGKVLAYLYVIEFQKRGLPHAHMLLIRNEGPRTADDIDRFVRAEIPSCPSLREIVVKQMVHGPCGRENPRSPCMKDGCCSKRYPKPFVPRSSWDENATHPVYRRLAPDDDGETCTVRGRVVDNSWIVPYNPYLLAKYRCHINVEICSSVRACKYLFKYVYKGPDRAMVAVDCGRTQERNEIKQYQDMRSIGSSEACWRLFAFDMSNRSPAVIALPVHLENGQRGFFSNEAEAIQAANEPPRTHLTAWFLYNQQNAGDSSKLHLYCDMPQWCTWHKQSKSWAARRRKSGTIGRVHWIHPAAGDSFYLRMLLHHPHSLGKGSFHDLLTVDSAVHSTYQAACRSLGLLQDDTEWTNALQDAAHTMMCPQMRQLFVSILEFNSPADPAALLQRHIGSMSDDYERMLQRSGCPSSIQEEELLRGLVILDIEKRLERIGKTLDHYGLPTVATELRQIAEQVNGAFSISSLPSVLREEMGYDRTEQEHLAHTAFSQMLPSQRDVVDPAIESILSGRQMLAFWDAPAGTGKTFCMNALLSATRAKGMIAISVATSGIAAVLMRGGRTFHSRFKAPLSTNAQTVFPIKHGTPPAELLRRAVVICWDESPMAHKHLLEALDRTLRDLMMNDLPFGGKSIILGGDFREVLPVVKRGSRAEIVKACFKKSSLWRLFKVFRLTENMRVRRNGVSQEAESYAKWLLELGDGRIGEASSDAGEAIIDIRSQRRTPGINLDELISWTYPKLSAHNEVGSIITEGAILCTRNDMVDDVNLAVARRFPGSSTWTLHSADALNRTDNS